MENKMLNLSKAARMIGVDRVTLYRWIWKGKIPKRLTPMGKPFLLQTDIDAILNGTINNDSVQSTERQ